MVADNASVASVHQQVALLATANGTHIAVQVSMTGRARARGGKGTSKAGKLDGGKGHLAQKDLI